MQVILDRRGNQPWVMLEHGTAQLQEEQASHPDMYEDDYFE